MFYRIYADKGVNMSENVIETIGADEYISVADFAARAGCSKQAVYQALNKKLNPYVKVIDGRKTINSKALREVYGKEIQLESQSIVKEVDQELNKELIVLLKSQIEEKDQQINELHRLLATSQMQLTESVHRVQELEDKQCQQLQEKQEELKEDQQEKVEKKSWIRRFFGI